MWSRGSKIIAVIGYLRAWRASKEGAGIIRTFAARLRSHGIEQAHLVVSVALLSRKHSSSGRYYNFAQYCLDIDAVTPLRRTKNSGVTRAVPDLQILLRRAAAADPGLYPRNAVD